MRDRKMLFIITMLFLIARSIVSLMSRTNSLFYAIIMAIGGLFIPVAIGCLIYAFRKKDFCTTLSIMIAIMGVISMAGSFVEMGR